MADEVYFLRMLRMEGLEAAVGEYVCVVLVVFLSPSAPSSCRLGTLSCYWWPYLRALRVDTHTLCTTFYSNTQYPHTFSLSLPHIIVHF